MKKVPKIEILRHSLAHVLAAAVLEMFPEAKFGIGPAIENGFYYDFDLPRTLIPEDLEILEEKMHRIIKENHPFEKAQVSASLALKNFKKAKQPYKVELIKDLQKENKSVKQKDNIQVIIYKTGNFVDLCSGPHLDSTGEINPKAFKLTKISGAYWKGNEKNKMLQRIYGVAFETPKELGQYLAKLEEAEKRDHRRLGKELDLFSMPEIVGGGLPIWHPRGAVIRKEIEDFWKKRHEEKGYQLIYSPHIGNAKIWKISGHLDFYQEHLYSPIDIDNEQYLLKPMNCPFHIFVYQSRMRSYKDLPIKFCELGTVYRYEKSGVLHGLTRVRGFTQDDAHIFCTPANLDSELVKIIDFAIDLLKTFGFQSYEVYLSTQPDKFIGSAKNWELATKALKSALKKTKLKYKIDPGEGVFYGPKIDIKIKDSLGRSWQCTTIQIDFNLPEKFKIFYTDAKGKKQQPIMIHRALLGSLERFIGVLLEHYGGNLPLWLSPVQVEVLPISEKFEKYGKEIHSLLLANNIRSIIRESSESLGKRIREAQNKKINYMLIVGEKERKAKTVAVRDREKGDLGAMKIEKFLGKARQEIIDKK